MKKEILLSSLLSVSSFSLNANAKEIYISNSLDNNTEDTNNKKISAEAIKFTAIMADVYAGAGKQN